jgi:hypothetical protein
MCSLAYRCSYGVTLTRKCGQPGLHRVRDEPHTTPVFSAGIDDKTTILTLREEDLPEMRAALAPPRRPARGRRERNRALLESLACASPASRALDGPSSTDPCDDLFPGTAGTGRHWALRPHLVSLSRRGGAIGDAAASRSVVDHPSPAPPRPNAGPAAGPPLRAPAHRGLHDRGPRGRVRRRVRGPRGASAATL